MRTALALAVSEIRRSSDFGVQMPLGFQGPDALRSPRPRCLVPFRVQGPGAPRSQGPRPAYRSPGIAQAPLASGPRARRPSESGRPSVSRRPSDLRGLQIPGAPRSPGSSPPLEVHSRDRQRQGEAETERQRQRQGETGRDRERQREGETET